MNAENPVTKLSAAEEAVLEKLLALAKQFRERGETLERAAAALGEQIDRARQPYGGRACAN